MAQERDYSLLPPDALNSEFRMLFVAAPAVGMSVLGTLMEESSTEMTDEQRVVYLEELTAYRDEIYHGMTLEEVEEQLGENERELIIEQAKGEAARRGRDNSFYNAALLNKLEPFMPFVQGTSSFKEYIRREMKRITIDGIGRDGQDHWLYGDDLGGIFHHQSAPPLEAKSFQMFASDINWYGVSPIVGRVFEPSYEDDPIYKSAVDLGRQWKIEFQERYQRVPLDVHGREITIP